MDKKCLERYNEVDELETQDKLEGVSTTFISGSASRESIIHRRSTTTNGDIESDVGISVHYEISTILG
eukprot:5666897-Pyramimonas_sp.AAC.1